MLCSPDSSQRPGWGKCDTVTANCGAPVRTRPPVLATYLKPYGLAQPSETLWRPDLQRVTGESRRAGWRAQRTAGDGDVPGAAGASAPGSKGCQPVFRVCLLTSKHRAGPWGRNIWVGSHVCLYIVGGSSAFCLRGC